MLQRLKLLTLRTFFYRQHINQFLCKHNKNIVSSVATFASEKKPERDKFVTQLVQNENRALYQHLLLNKNYRLTIAFLDYVNEKSGSEDVSTLLNCDLIQLPNHKLVENFKALLHSFCNDPPKLDDTKFVTFCEFLIDKVPELLDDQLLNILKVLTLWPRSEDGNKDLFYSICKAIDDETNKRSRNWGRDQMLLTMDHFHRLGVMNFSAFAWDNMKRLCRTPQRLLPRQLVQTLFLVMCQRRWHPGVNFIEWELALAENIYELSVEEATIIALGFFKTNRRISNYKLLKALMMKLEGRMDTLDSISLTALLKVIRFCVPCNMRHELLPLLDKLKDVVDQHSLTCCVHIATLGTRQPIFHAESLNKIYCRFVKEISKARLKEIERMLFVASLFNFNPDTNPNFFDLAIDELKHRDEEISVFHQSFIYAVQFLCVRGIFDYDLINKALSEDFLSGIYKEITKYSIRCNIVQIACCAKLDCTDYNGNNLNMDLIDEFNSVYNSKSCAVENKLSTKREVIYMQTKTNLEDMFGGSKFVHLTHVLPYSNAPQLIFCLKDGKPVILPDEIREKYYVEFKPASTIGDWYAIEIWSAGARIGNTDEPVGSVRSKLRHLRLLGYKCSLLQEEKWEDLNVNKREYLKSLISSSL